MSPPMVFLWLTETYLSAKVRNGQASFNAHERIHDLSVGKLGLLHVKILFEKFLLLTLVVLRGDYRPHENFYRDLKRTEF